MKSAAASICTMKTLPHAGQPDKPLPVVVTARNFSTLGKMHGYFSLCLSFNLEHEGYCYANWFCTRPSCPRLSLVLAILGR